MNARHEQQRIGHWSFVNDITWFRLLVAVPLMLLCAYLEQREWFLGILAISFFSDAIDGFLARRFGQTSRFGAMLDSWADVAAYSAITISVAVLWPQWLRTHWLAASVIVLSFLLPTIVGFAKFHKFTSYHTYLVKLAVMSVALSLFAAFLFDFSMPFQIASAIALIAAAEEIAISCVLDAPRSDVRSLYHIRHSSVNHTKVS